MTAPDREDGERPSVPPALADALMALPDLPAAELAAELRPLREAWPDHAEFLDRYLQNLGELDDPALDAALPGAIGPYHLIELVGTGGMGTVYRAERNDTIRMTVAIKVIRAGLAGAEILRRFEYERRALAAMNHPAIARILDAGSLADGRPYYVMEFVEGEPLTQYCDRRRLGLLPRLRLFQRICSGVQHAHQKGVIHRDLKPHNILIAQEGGEPAPKVLDFGLAKPTDRELIGEDATAPELHAGTPAYMAPEQAAGDPGRVDSRADIYSLGVILYELLTGALPFSATMLRRAGTEEALRILQEVAPLRPSLRYSTASEDAAIAAALRSSTAGSLLRSLRRDLDWIAMRALAKDPGDRYQSAIEFSEDVQRFLDHAPVRAAPQSRLYRMRKFVRQRRAVAIAAVLVLLTAMAGGWATLRYAYRAEQEAFRANLGEQRANANAAEVRRQSEELAHGAARLESALAEETTALRRAEQREYETRIGLAEAELDAGEAVLPRKNLLRAPEDLRGFEWYHLTTRIDGSRHVLRGHDDNLRSIAVSPDGRWFATSAHDNTVVFWDTATMQPSCRWPGHPTCPVPIVAHPDGDRLFVVREHHSVMAWSVSRRRVLWEHRDTKGPRPVRLACFASGALLAVAFDDGSFGLLDPGTGEERRRNRGKAVECTALAGSGDGEDLLIGRFDGGVEVRRAVDGSLRAELTGLDSTIVDVGFCCRGERMVAATERAIACWNRGDGAMVHVRSAAGPAIRAMSVSPDGTRLATTESDGTVRIRDADSLDVQERLVGHTERYLAAVAFTADGNGVLSGGNDLTVREWRLDDAPVRVLTGARSWFPGFALGSDGAIAECGGNQGHYRLGEPALLLWSPDGALRWRRPLDGTTEINRLLFDAGNAHVFGGTESGEIVAFDAVDGRVVERWQAHEQVIVGLVRVPGSNAFASASRGTSVMFWSPTSPDGLGHRLSRTFEVGAPIRAFAFSPDGRWMAVGCHESRPTLVFDLAAGRRILTLEGHAAGVVSVAFDPAGTRLATASTDHTAKLWSLADGGVLATMRHSDWVFSVAFSPDGTRLATGSWDATVGIWDGSNGDRLAMLHGHQQRVCDVVFTPNGDRLVSNDGLGAIHVWDTEPDPKLRRGPQALRAIAALALRTHAAAKSMARQPCVPDELQAWQRRWWLPLQQQVVDLRRERDVLALDASTHSTAPTLPTAPLTGRQEPLSAADLTTEAWSLVRPSVVVPRADEAHSALALAREALLRVDQRGDRSIERSSVLDVMALGLAASGAGQEALDREREALRDAAPARWQAAADGLERLETMLARLRAAASREQLAVPAGGSGDPEEAAAIAALSARLDDCAQAAGNVIDGVLRRRDAAARSAPRDAARRWQEAAAAILAADDVAASAAYRADGPLRLQPVDGLVPIGMNPKTRLWEFYDLASAADPTTVPNHDGEGNIAMASGTGVIFVLVPGGTFTMGAESGAAAGLHREVHLGAYLIARHELTQAQWQRLSAGEQPSVFCAGLRFPGDASPATDTCPVENVTFDRAIEVLHWNGYDLPTEAQWEYGARADGGEGLANVFDLDGLARMRTREHEALRAHDGRATTAPVGSHPPNVLGLFDMRGNVAEWCSDWLVSYSQPTATATGRRGDPDSEGASRVVRGGSWRSIAAQCSPTARSGHDPHEGTACIGIRVVRNLR